MLGLATIVVTHGLVLVLHLAVAAQQLLVVLLQVAALLAGTVVLFAQTAVLLLQGVLIFSEGVVFAPQFGLLPALCTVVYTLDRVFRTTLTMVVGIFIASGITTQEILLTVGRSIFICRTFYLDVVL